MRLYPLVILLLAVSGCTPPSHKLVTGKASEVFAHGTDLVVYLEGDKSEAAYYINRYLDGGASLDSLKHLILNKDLRIRYLSQYTILNPQGRSRPIDTLYIGNVKLY